MKVSVCIATYNGERYVREQIQSILPQLKPHDEVIISDDHSTDTTVQQIRSLNDDRLKVITNTGKRGPVWNFENALKNATGDIIFLSDQDDTWYPNKIEVCLKGLDKYDLVTSDANVVDGAGNIIFQSYYESNKCRRGILYNLYKNSYLGCCLAFRRNVLEKCLPFPANTPMHDIWIGMVAECFFKPVMLKDILVKYRRHGENFSTASSKSTNSLKKKLTFRINLVTGIIGRYFGK